MQGLGYRSTQRKIPRGREDEDRLTADIIELAQQYGRYGYRKVAGLVHRGGSPATPACRVPLTGRARPACLAGRRSEEHALGEFNFLIICSGILAACRFKSFA